MTFRSQIYTRPACIHGQKYMYIINFRLSKQMPKFGHFMVSQGTNECKLCICMYLCTLVHFSAYAILGKYKLGPEFIPYTCPSNSIIRDCSSDLYVGMRVVEMF